MEKKRKISQYRQKLDKTLASPELINQETLKTLIKNQLLSSSLHGNEDCKEDLLDKRTIEVSNILDKLRSASVKEHEVSRSSEASHGDWKLKEDNEDFRIMYREGAQGTPFHTLLVEGYVDGPVDACVCISWESSLYHKWWPQTVFPSFKVTHNKCLKKVRTDEQISSVRMKVPWPLTDREAVVHFFLFEYFQDDLIVVLFNSISDLESIEKSSNGFTKNGISDAQNAVMIDVVGGFALQKVTPETSYFRTIATIDIKLDLMPPSLMNFISRQLVGNGFRLYQKAVASVSKFDEDYSKALGDPLYTKIREALYSARKPNEAQEEKQLQTNECVSLKQHLAVNMQDEEYKNDTQQKQELVVNMQDEEYKIDAQQKFHRDEQHASESLLKNNEPDEECTEDMRHKLHTDEHFSESSSKKVTGRNAFCEIEEESEESMSLDEEDSEGSNVIAESHMNGERAICISPEVEQALGTLEKVISMVRKNRLGVQGQAMPSCKELRLAVRNDLVKDQTSSEKMGIVSNRNVSVELPKKEVMERSSHESRASSGIHSIRRVGSSSFTREGNHNRIAPASPEQDLSTSNITSIAGILKVSFLGQTTQSNKQMRDETDETNDTNNFHGEKKPTQQKKHRLCCFGFTSR